MYGQLKTDHTNALSYTVKEDAYSHCKNSD